MQRLHSLDDPLSGWLHYLETAGPSWGGKKQLLDSELYFILLTQCLFLERGWSSYLAKKCRSGSLTGSGVGQRC